MTRALMIGGLLAAILLQGAAADASDRATREEMPTTAVGYRGTIVFSDYTARFRRYRLVAKVGSRRQTLPVPSRSVPFDVDLGPGRRGETIAVYSRCRREPQALISNRPRYTDGRGCSLYQYSFRTRRETRLAGSRETRGSEVLPTIWRQRIAFAGRRRNAVPPRPELFIRRLGSSKSRRLRGGTPGQFTPFDGSPRDPDNYSGGPGPIQVDLRGNRLAFLWGLDTGDCGVPDPEKRFNFGQQTEVWIGDLERRARLVDKACAAGGDVSFFFGLGFGSDWLLYGASPNSADAANQQLRGYRSTDRRYGTAALPLGTIDLALDGQRLITQEQTRDDRGRSSYEVHQRLTPAFTDTMPASTRSTTGPTAGSEVRTFAR